MSKSVEQKIFEELGVDKLFPEEVKPCVMASRMATLRFSYLPSCMKLTKASNKLWIADYDSNANLKGHLRQILGIVTKSDIGKYYALYQVNPDKYIIYECTDDKECEHFKKVFTVSNQTHKQETGFVNKQGQLHLSLLDFYLMCGYTNTEWKDQRIQKDGGFVIREDTSENKCELQIWYEPTSAEYDKYDKAERGISAPEVFTKKTFLDSSNPLNVHIPQNFYKKGIVSPGQTLVFTREYAENGLMRLVAEPMPTYCECCGKPVSINAHDGLSGAVCKPCFDSLEKARAIIGNYVSDGIENNRFAVATKSMDEIIEAAKNILVGSKI